MTPRHDERQPQATRRPGAAESGAARITLTVPSDFARGASGAAPRLDRYLADCFPEVSRAEFMRLIDSGAVRLDGRVARKGEPLAGGETIALPLPCARGDWALLPEPGRPLAVIYEDEAILAIEKPAGAPCHPIRPEERGTVANVLVARFPSQAAIGLPLEGGFVHRLDTGTSGVLVAARTAAAYARLRSVWSTGEVVKTYLAIVEGAVARAGEIDAPLAQHGRSARRMVLAARGVARGALAAHTRYEPIRGPRSARVAAAGGAGTSARTLLRVVIREGRRHQIRVHLASIGFPVAGDEIYGSSAPAPRLALHAHRVAFPHPATGVCVVVESALPRDLEALLDA